MDTDEFKDADSKWFNHGLRMVAIVDNDGELGVVWQPGSGAQYMAAKSDELGDNGKRDRVGHLVSSNNLRLIALDAFSGSTGIDFPAPSFTWGSDGHHPPGPQ
jgi:hypothetical protein